jgi:hypothetical protein
MATRNEMIVSKYIQKGDLLQPTRLTVSGCENKDIGKEGKPEWKWVVEFEGEWKPLILNVTNTDAFFDTLGQDSVDWVGKQIILFNDQSVVYEGKKGGIRVYQQLQVADAQPPQSQNQPRTDDTGPLPTEPQGRIPGDAL